MSGGEELAGLIFCEFDNYQGAELVFQHPCELLSNAEFTGISEYLIPKPELCNRDVIINTSSGTVVVGHPVLISHRKYARNLLQFNVGFVFRAGVSPALLRAYKPVARKLAETLRMLEEEAEFLYKEESKGRLFRAFIPAIFAALNDPTKRMCRLQVDDANSVRLCLFPPPPSRREVNPSHVAVPLEECCYPPPAAPRQIHFWNDRLGMGAFDDLGMAATFEAIQHSEFDAQHEVLHPSAHSSLPAQAPEEAARHAHSMRRLFERRRLDPTLARTAVQLLQSCNLLKVVPHISYSDKYSVTARVRELLASPSAQSACVAYVKLQQEELALFPQEKLPPHLKVAAGGLHPEWAAENLRSYRSAQAVGAPDPSFRDVFAIYCSFDGACDLRSFSTYHRPHTLGIHECRLVMYGLVNGILRRDGISDMDTQLHMPRETAGE